MGAALGGEMTSGEFVAVLARLRDRHGWPGEGQSEVARLLGVRASTVRRYVAAAGAVSARSVPEPVARLMLLMDADPRVVGRLRRM